MELQVRFVLRNERSYYAVGREGRMARQRRPALVERLPPALPASDAVTAGRAHGDPTAA